MAFVYIIEAPGPEDLFHGVSEGAALAASLKLAGIPNSSRLAVDRKRMLQALSTNPSHGGIGAEMAKHNDIPILHLSMHGNREGIAPTDGDLLSWEEMYAAIKGVNDQLPVGLLVCMSSCEGFFAATLARQATALKPIYGLVGSPEAIRWTDGLVGFTTFYHHWFNNSTMDFAMQAMRMASGHRSFTALRGEGGGPPTWGDAGRASLDEDWQ